MEGFEFYKPREFLNVSALMEFERCPRKYFYHVGCELSKSEESNALLYGEAMHNAIPELLSGEPSTKLIRAMEKFNKVWNPLLSDPKRNADRAKMVLFEFASTHQPGKGLYELVHPKDLPFVSGGFEVSDRVSEYEVPFVVVLPGLPLPVVGRIDGIARLKDTGEYALVEYKTTSQMWDFFSAFQLSPQTLLYNAGAKVNLPFPITKVIIQAIEVSKTKESSLASPITIQDHHVEACVNWAVDVGKRIIKCDVDKNFPQHFTGCHPYGMFGSHGWLCDYYNLCYSKDWTQNVTLYVRKPDKRYEVFFPSGGKMEATGF